MNVEAHDLIDAIKNQRDAAQDEAAAWRSMTKKLERDICALSAELAKLKEQGDRNDSL